MIPQFAHLRARTSYSLSSGAIKVKDLIDLCTKYQVPAIAVTDFNNLFCALEFSKQALDNGIKPIIGTTIAFKYESKNDESIDEIVLLVKNETGYKNLLELFSIFYLNNNQEKFITIDDLKKNSDGLIVLSSGDFGTINKLVSKKNYLQAENFAKKLQNIFQSDFYIEISRCKNNQQEEEKLLELAYELNIPIVATNDIFFAEQNMHEAHDTLICIAKGRYTDEIQRPKSNPEHYFKSPRSLYNNFQDIPEAYENTINIAKKCSFALSPNKPMLPRLGDNETDLLLSQTKSGLEQKIKNIKNKSIYYKRLEYELNVITSMNFSGYFLIVSDFIRWSKKNKIPVGPGRGSGAGSLVAWSLDITDLDPIKFGLIFERFLNPERISMPDFDIDFCQERREEVIKYVQHKYGTDKVAQIITFGKLQAKAVIRDVGRVLQMPYGQVDRISKMVPFNAVNPVTLKQAIEIEPMLQKAKKEDEQVAKLLSIALKLEGLHRHASTHAAGIVIGEKALKEIVPLYKEPKSDMMVVQFSMKYAEMSGLVKFDFLGLKTLTVIAKAENFIKEKIEDFSIKDISFDDKKTYELLATGLSMGIFQFESIGMRDSLRKLKPDSIKDLMALGALYRPGPMENIPTYIACKHGKQSPDYMHKDLQEILEETYGVIIYQEQVLQVAQKLAGYSLGSADLLRRAMGKKIKSEMDDQRKMFVNGAIKNNISSEQAHAIFDKVAKFAGYGFNRAHAASYAVISYQTAFLKANYTIEFITACLNTDINDTDKINLFVNDAAKLNIKIYPPDINQSNVLFKIENKAIRYAIGALKNIGQQSMEEILKERDLNGNFKDLFDFCERVDPKDLNKRQLESLVKSGALDSIIVNRKTIFENIEIILSYNNFVHKNKNTDQINLFSSKSQSSYRPNIPQKAEWEQLQKTNFEFDSYGFYLENHPMDNYNHLAKNLGLKNSEDINTKLENGLFDNIIIAGIAQKTKTRMSQKGKFISVLMSDNFGSIEFSIFDSELISSASEHINSAFPLVVSCEVKKDDGGVRITAKKITKLDDYLIKTRNVTYNIKKEDTLLHFKNVINNAQNGDTSILVNIYTSDQVFTTININKKVLFDITLYDKLLAIKDLNLSLSNF